VIIGLVLKALAISVIGVAASQLAWRCRASVRHATLLAMFVAIALLPIATLGLPAFAINPPQRFLDVLPVSARPEGQTLMTGDHVPLRPAGHKGVRAGGPDTVAAVDSPFFVRDAVIALWLAGATLLIVSLALGVVRVQRLRRRALPAILQGLPVASPEGLTFMWWRRRIELLTHESVIAPIALGIVRPAILLPRDAQDWDAAALQRALVHEIEHIRRHDWLTQLFARAICALFWFNPVTWMAYRRLTLNAEHACDDAVVYAAAGTQDTFASEANTVYAHQLVTLARRLNTRAHSAVVGMAHRSDLTARVHAVLDASKARGRAGAARALMIATAAALALAVIAPLRMVAAPIAPPESEALAADRSTSARESQRRASSRDRALLEAIDAGDIGEVRELLDDGANVNATIDGDGSPLIVASREGHVDIVRLLLQRGADVNLAVPGDGSPLIMAAREGQLEIVQLLLDHGAKVDMAVSGDENALIQASGEGYLEVVKVLVASGANVNMRVIVELPYDAVITSSDGTARPYNARRRQVRTPLTQAVRGGHTAVADFLRANGAVE
jgi:beta-lactamase regulating signal transducer with metallopeptidase domain